ncbi:MAG: response regulator [Candidatus Melainabacteria bacterium]
MKQPIRILHIDDEPGALSSFRRCLRREGFEIDSALTPGEAIQLVSQHHYDLVVIDVFMPEMNGFRLLEELRSIDASLCSLVLTGIVDEAVLYQTVFSECEAYLEKPIDRDWLVFTVRRLLGERKRRALTPST